MTQIEAIPKIQALLGEITANQRMLERLQSGEPVAVMVGEGYAAGSVTLIPAASEALRVKTQVFLEHRVRMLIREKDELARLLAEDTVS